MPTKKYINKLAYQIIGCAIEVHKELGPGLLESIYEECLYAELKKQGINVKRQVEYYVNYKGEQLDQKLRVDLVVEDLIITELKCVEAFNPVHKAILLSYMKLAQMPKGLLINFHTDNISKSVVHLVNEIFANLPEE